MKPMTSEFIREKKSKSIYFTKTREQSENENPTPLQFDRFIPWLCLQMHVPNQVTVKRIIKDEHIAHESRRASSTKFNSMESISQSRHLDFTKKRDSEFSTSSLSSYGGASDNIIKIKSYYDHRNRLVEVAIINCHININRKVIQAINLCLPFHEHFKKFKITGGGLTEAVLYEIGKLLPHSNITEICLDDTYLPSGNYYVLFEKENPLQSISLCRCKINDVICKNIADKLSFGTPASKSLVTLDLTSNRITDLGASYLGGMLRMNRCLLYLNLSDNIIGYTGASNILQSLMSFSLTEDETYELKKRRFKYSAEKLEEYNRIENVLLEHMKSEHDKENISLKPVKGVKSKIKKRVSVNVSLAFNESVKEQAIRMTIEKIGKFKDVFDDGNVNYKDGKLYCMGNLKLCYLNLAYNDVKYFFIEKLREVLEYQSSITRPYCTGLLRVVIDGNNIPIRCDLLEIIESYLRKAVKKYLPMRVFSRSASYLGRKWQRRLLHLNM